LEFVVPVASGCRSSQLPSRSLPAVGRRFLCDCDETGVGNARAGWWCGLRTHADRGELHVSIHCDNNWLCCVCDRAFHPHCQADYLWSDYRGVRTGTCGHPVVADVAAARPVSETSVRHGADSMAFHRDVSFRTEPGSLSYRTMGVSFQRVWSICVAGFCPAPA